MAQTEVELPWLDEELPIEEAIEAIAQASQDDADEFESLKERFDRIERRLSNLEHGDEIECPSCGSTEDVLKSGVAAAKLVREGSLSDKNVTALNEESHVCLSCNEAFTPSV